MVNKHTDPIYFLGMTYDTVLGIVVVFWMLLIVAMVARVVYGIIVNERNFKKFRNNLKVGDKTTTGTITKIEGDDVTIEIVTKKDRVYPTSDNDSIGIAGKIYRYKDDQ